MRLAVIVLTLLVFAAPARAAGPELGIADDRILFAGGAAADEAVRDWSALGVEQVRILALWSRIAPSAPGGEYSWAQLDHVVDRVVGAGMAPLLTITGPGPLWVSRRAERGDPRYDPDPDALRRVRGGGCAALRRPCGSLRAVERAQPRELAASPGELQRARGCTPVAPHLYRALVRAAYPAVHAADPGAQVLIGTMSSRGGEQRSENSTARPLVFLRALGCVNASFKKVRTGRCKGFKPATGDGFAFHPHGVLTAPDRAFPHPDDVSLASLPRLESALDKLQRGGALKATTSRFNLYLDEYGYQTNPPDRISGISATAQNTWLQRAAYQAWRDPRVKLLTQYLWHDEPVNLDGTYSGWQSGLRYTDGRAKPSLRGFETPFVLDATRSRLWGQVRSRATRTVTVQRRLRGNTRWRDVATRTTDARGYWSWTTQPDPRRVVSLPGRGSDERNGDSQVEFAAVSPLVQAASRPRHAPAGARARRRDRSRAGRRAGSRRTPGMPGRRARAVARAAGRDIGALGRRDA